MNPYIRTQSGIAFDLLEPTVDMVDLLDMARACARTIRFTGHAGTYSVAEHMLNVAGRVDELGGTPGEVAQALVHDAHEAYVGDTSSPMKRAMRGFGNGYDVIEARVWAVVAEFFGVPVGLSPLVKRADLELCDAEGRAFLPNWTPIPGVERLPVRRITDHRCPAAGFFWRELVEERTLARTRERS